MPMNRYWTLSGKPLGPWPDADTFELREAPMPTPGPGQALTRTIYISLDPYQWGYKKRGTDKPGLPCHARTVSQVVESRIDGLAPRDFVFNTNGWAEYGLMGEGIARPPYMIPRKLDPAQGRISQAVGVLGMLGLTAYAGMVLMGQPKRGETAVVSAASGGVGQIAGQLAKSRGARVVGIAGREQKCRYVVDELGFDACVSHLSPTFAAGLRNACPSGIDVYFENVGGAHLQAALANMRQFGRIAACGMIAQYNATEPLPGPNNLSNLIGLRLTIRGFLVGDHLGLHAQFLDEMARWHGEGKMKWRETISNGIESAPDAFIGLFKGEHIGKVLVRVGPDEAVK